MEERTVLYYNGLSARPAEVRVLFLNGELHLYEETGEHLIQKFLLAGMAHNEVGNTHYVYLDAKGLQYLQISADHPLAKSLSKQVVDANPYWGQTLIKQKISVLLLLVVV